MTVSEFVSMQMLFPGIDPIRFDVNLDNEDRAYTIDNADELGPLEVTGWFIEDGRMQLVARGTRVDLVSAELPAGAEL